MRAELPPSQAARATIVVSLDGESASHYLMMVDQGTVVGEPTNRTVFVASQPIRLYADVDPEPGVKLGTAYASISGH